MKNKAIIGLGMLACACVAFAAKDPIIMTVGNIQVPLSEFEYLYHKNSQQQLQAQPLDEYVEMFKLYKMKVADAAAAGIDTTAKFRREMNQYRDELAAPFLSDTLFLQKLAMEAADRAQNETEVIHIMRLKRYTHEDNVKQLALLDSIRTAIVNGADFGELAKKYSDDKQSAANGGSMGYVPGSSLPYGFENVLLSTPEGQISQIVESPMAYHIIKGAKTRPTHRIRASHILRSAERGSGAEMDAAVKAQMDSLYLILKADPSKFEEIARRESQDRGSAQRGGDLGVFGPNQMVQPFSDVAFSLSEGEISEPVRTRYGWHIIKRTGTEKPKTFEENRDGYMRRINNVQDEDRQKLIRRHEIDRIAPKFKTKSNEKTVEALKKAAAQGDSVYNAAVEGELADAVVFNTTRGPILVSEFAKSGIRPWLAGPDAGDAIDVALDKYLLNRLMDMERDRLVQDTPEYRNLLKEYRDGSMLYEISLAKVWERASQDLEGQQKYFDTHRADFKWTEPRVKGYLVKAVNDSVLNEVRKRMEQLTDEDMLLTIRNEFAKQAKIDKVLLKKGDNPLVDFLIFNPEEVKPSPDVQYPSYFMFNPVLLEQPSALEDVRGLVTAAYQDQLEQDWVHELQSKYPVTVNTKVLKKVK